MEQTHVVAEADDFEDNGTKYEESSLASLTANNREHRTENGRTYHSMSAGNYNLTLDDGLAVAPAHKTARRVLDMGRGTGVWAIEYDERPQLICWQAIGVDLSPTQSEWAPSNCVFEIDDLEEDWTWTRPFDYVFCRTMEGSFADPPAVVRKAYKAPAPGGWFEAGGFVLPLGCDDGTLLEVSSLRQWQELMIEAGYTAGRSIESAAKYADAIANAGFVDITVKRYNWAPNSWPRDAKLKDIGKWHNANLNLGLEALSLALFTHALGWSQEEVLALCAGVWKDLKNKNTHAYWNVQVTYARKPEKVFDEDQEGMPLAQQF
ncbi:methyltransferase domain-containing protein [Colletotrichum eremochloae]|nr:methyltransferase domain-containing protein [Colletotrichum eremochloae]